ncbi:MAG: alpha/beta fold hydrolase [Anaerolineae bacterium]
MNTNELLMEWSNLSLEEIEARLQAAAAPGEGARDLAPASAGAQDAVDRIFGPEEAEELRALAAQPQARGLLPSVVLLPGIMGSQLASVRGVTKLLWINPMIFLKGESSYLELNEDGTDDRHPEIEAVATAVEKMTYLKIALTLRREVDLYEFPYDWRRPIEESADLLHRTLERWSDGDPDRKFTLVGHSMGGIVSRAYLARHPQDARRRIERVIMHGSPQFGAAQTIQNLIEGNRMMSIAGFLNSDNNTRRLLLNLPSVYQILPPPPDLFPGTRPYPADWDLYDADAWRLDGIRQDYLNAARDFHELLAGVKDSEAAEVEVIQIAGCNLETMVEARRRSTDGDRWELEPMWMEEGPDSGDGTVPLWSALLPGATFYYVQEVHRDLPKNRDVRRATVELIHGGIPDLPTELPKAKFGLFGRDALEPAEVEAERLRRELETGNAGEEELANLFFAF